MAQACDRIISNLRKEGLLIDVAFFNSSGQHFKNIQQQNGRLIQVPVSDNPGHALNCLYNYLSDPASKALYDYIVAFGGYLPTLALPPFKAWLKAHAVTMLRGNDFDLGIFNPTRRSMLTEAIASSETTCVLSHALKDRVAALFPKACIEVIANGIDCENWQCDRSDYEAANNWKERHITDNRLTIGIIGQLKEKKGVIFFLENAIRAGLHERFRFLLVGDVETRVQEWLDQRQEKLSLLQMPFLDRFELLRWYPVCDYIALPSHYDGMPNVLLEAGALAIPVIAARTAGIEEVLPESQRHLTFYPGNSEDCREALWRAANLSKTERKKVATCFKKHIGKHFTDSKESSAYLALFEKQDKTRKRLKGTRK